jgi:site-specific recombinase XerC
MSDKLISNLRRRMIADMTIRTFSDKTQRDYLRQIEAFASFLGRSPDAATGDEIRRFQFAQVEQGAQPPKMNAQASALRFFFTITLSRADLAPSAGPHALSAEAAAGPCAGSRRPADRGRTGSRSQAQGRAQRRLRRRSARL